MAAWIARAVVPRQALCHILCVLRLITLAHRPSARLHSLHSLVVGGVAPFPRRLAPRGGPVLPIVHFLLGFVILVVRGVGHFPSGITLRGVPVLPLALPMVLCPAACPIVVFLCGPRHLLGHGVGGVPPGCGSESSGLRARARARSCCHPRGTRVAHPPPRTANE